MKTVIELIPSPGIHANEVTTHDATVYSALMQMAQRNIGALPVFKEGVLIGVFSERDCARKLELKERDAKTTLVSEIMSTPAVCVGPHHSVEECMKLMIDKGFRHLPILSNGDFLGILSIKDIVKSVLNNRDEFMREIADITAERGDKINRENMDSFRSLADSIRQGLIPILTLLKETESPDIRTTRAIDELDQVLDQFESHLQPLLQQMEGVRTLEQVKVLLTHSNPADEVLAKLALGGTGVTLHSVQTSGEAIALLDQCAYDIVCVDHKSIDVAIKANEKNNRVNTIFLTSENAENYLSDLKAHSFLSNIISHSEADRAFTIKSIHSAVSKIATSDYFGLEKYLNWGTEVKEQKVTGSSARPQIIDNMKTSLRSLGLRRTLIDRCANVAEELLMNAIYDAPTDTSGKHIYNHLPRSEAVELPLNDQPVFRYGCDGMFLAISVRDPFGTLTRDTIINYLESCFSGQESELHKNKGGGGHGLFIILRSAHMTIFNVKKGGSTEVISLFDLEPKQSDNGKKSSFQYFSV